MQYFVEELKTSSFHDNPMCHDLVGAGGFNQTSRGPAIDDFVLEAVEHLLGHLDCGDDFFRRRGAAREGQDFVEVGNVLKTFEEIVVGGAFHVKVVGIHSFVILGVRYPIGAVDLRKVVDLFVDKVEDMGQKLVVHVLVGECGGVKVVGSVVEAEGDAPRDG